MLVSRRFTNVSGCCLVYLYFESAVAELNCGVMNYERVFTVRRGVLGFWMCVFCTNVFFKSAVFLEYFELQLL